MRWHMLLGLLPLLCGAGQSEPAGQAVAVGKAWDAEQLLDGARPEAAVEAYTKAIPKLAATFGEAGARTLVAMNNLAAALLELNRPAEAEALLRDVLDRRQRAALPEDLTLAVTWANLGEAFLASGKLNAAVAQHEKALALKRRLFSPGDPEIANSLTGLGEALRQSGELTRARKVLDEALSVWAAPAKGRTGAASLPLMPGYGHVQNSLGMLHDAEGRRGDAERAFLAALETSQAVYGTRSMFTAIIEFNLAGHYALFGDWKRADAHCRRALEVYELQPAHQDDRLQVALSLHALVLDKISGHKEEARAQRQRANTIRALR